MRELFGRDMVETQNNLLHVSNEGILWTNNDVFSRDCKCKTWGERVSYNWSVGYLTKAPRPYLHAVTHAFPPVDAR